MKSLVILSALFAVGLCANQKFTAVGRLMCDDKPASGIQVKLQDKDVGLDDTLGNERTDAQGNFRVEGQAGGGLTGIDPVLKIYHKCGDSISMLKCHRKFTFKMPKSYVVDASRPSKPYNVGTINLNVKLENSEDRNCV